jgi:hypothetical protein
LREVGHTTNNQAKKRERPQYVLCWLERVEAISGQQPSTTTARLRNTAKALTSCEIAMATSVEITFDGTKFYWKTRNTVDVVIAHHIAHKVFEVIVYEPTLDREAPRLYLNEEILMPKIDHNEVNSKLSFAKRNNVPLTEKLVQGIMNKAISDFILNRLVIQQLAALEKKFDVGIKIDDYDVMLSANFKDLVCSRPDGLVMHEAKHYKNLM